MNTHGIPQDYKEQVSLALIETSTSKETVHMGIIGWIILGGLAGWVASIIMKTDEEQGILLNVFTGVIGAMIGGFLLSIFGGEGVDGFNFYSFLVALLGAVILIAIVKALRRT